MLQLDLSSSILLIVAGPRTICSAALLLALNTATSPRNFSDFAAMFSNDWRCSGAKDGERGLAGNLKTPAGSFMTSFLPGLLVLAGNPGSDGGGPGSHEGLGLRVAVVQAGCDDGGLCEPVLSSSILVFTAGPRTICSAALLGALKTASTPRIFSDFLAMYCNGWGCS